MERRTKVCVLGTIAVMLVTASTSAAFPRQDNRLTKLVAVHPYGLPGEMTATADSSLLYVSEGGTIAIIEADDQQSHYDTPIKQVRVGELAVAASGLLLDPNDEEYLYIAGGRMGLWVMDADPDPANDNPVARVDDSGNLIVASQNSRRWCNALGTFRLVVNGSPVDYLVALFSKANHTRLRVFKLEDVRDVLEGHSGVEMGNEILPIHSTHLDGNSTPAFPIGSPPPLPFSFGYGLAVDNPDESRADVYVAVGMHGIVRVTYLPDHFLNPSQPPYPTKEDGPVFGDLTDYAAGNDLYGNLDYYENPGPTLFWSEPPFFVDVAVQNFDGAHFLYAAVDHLGWLRFDLNQTFGPNMSIDHHEGLEIPALGGQDLVSLHDPDGPGGQPAPVMYARKIEVVDWVDDPVVMVTANPRPVRMALDTLTEGYSLDFVGGAPKPILGDWSSTYGGGEPYTLAYRIGSGFTTHSTPSGDQSFARCNDGGCTLFAAPAQSSQTEIVFFAGESIPAMKVDDLGFFNTFRGEVTISTSMIDAIIRDKNHRAGRNNHHAGVFRNSENQALLLTGYNDGGFPEDGALFICGNEIKRWYPAGVGNQEICSTAIIPNTDAQWPESSSVWTWGSKKEPSSGDTFFSMTKFYIGQSLCDWTTIVPPYIEKQVYLAAIPDRFNGQPRGHYKGGTTGDTGYDAFIESQNPGVRYAFASRYGSSDGIVVLRRDLLQITANQIQSGTMIEDPFLAAAHVIDLETHPEYHNVDDYDMQNNPDSRDFLNQVGASGFTGTWSPKLFEHISSEGTRWLLAVPCSTVTLDPTHPVFNDPANQPGGWPDGDGGYHPDWAPDQVFRDNYLAAMTRIFDVSDPTLRKPLATLLGPGTETTTSDLEVVEVSGIYYLFAVGYVDGVSVWKLPDLDDPGTGPVPVYASSDNNVYFEYWQPPKSVTDLEDGSIFDLVIDKISDDEIWVYASVLRAGVQVLRFDPNQPFGDRLEPQGLIQTNARTSGLALRVDDQLEKTLIVSDLGAGIRVYGKP